MELVFCIGSHRGDVGRVETFVEGRFGPDFEIFRKRVSVSTSPGRHKHSSFPLKLSSVLFCQEIRSCFSFAYEATSWKFSGRDWRPVTLALPSSALTT